MRRHLPALLLAAAVVCIAAAALAPDGAAAEIAVALPGAFVAASIVAAARVRDLPQRRFWWLLAGGIACLAGGDIAYAIGMVAAGSEATAAIVGAPLYMIGYGVTAAAFLRAAAARREGGDRDALADSVLLAVVALAPAWPVVHHGWVAPVPAFDRVTAVAYPLLDVAVIALLSHLLFSTRRVITAGLLLLGTWLVMLAADVWYVFTITTGDTPRLLDLLFPLSYTLTAAAALVPSARELAVPTRRATAAVHPWRAVLLGSAVAVIPLTTLVARGVGEPVPAAWTLTVLVLTGGLVSWRMWVMTQRAERAHCAMREHRDFLASVLDTDPNLVWVRDRDGGYVLTNAAFDRRMDTDPQVPIPAEVFDGATVRRTEVLVDRDGGSRTYETVLAALPNQPQFVLGIAFDVTERIAAEQQLREEEAALASAEEVAGFGSFELDLESVQYRWSDSMCRMLGAEPGTEFSIDEALLLVHPEDRARVLAHHRRVALGGERDPIEYRVVVDGRPRVFRASVRLQPGTEARSARLVGAVQDVTEQRDAERELTSVRRAEQIVGSAARRFLESDPVAIAYATTVLMAEVAGYLDASSAQVRVIRNEALEVVGGWSSPETPFPDPTSWPIEDVRAARDDGLWLRHVDELETPELRAAFEDQRTRAAGILPVATSDQVIAVVAVQWSEDPPADAAQRLELLRPMADVLGVAIEHAAARTELRASEARLHTAFEHTPVGMAILDVDLRFVSVNPALERMLGRSFDACIRLTLDDVTAAEDREEQELLLREVTGSLRNIWRVEQRLQRLDGGSLWVQAEISAVRDELGQVTNLIGQFTDIGDRKELEIRLAEEATRDALTGLPNRKLLLDRLRIALARSSRRRTSVALLFLDLDRFKLVNDTHGHGVGDELLIEIGRRLEDVTRDDDTVARLGGDEFVVLCEDVGGEAEARIIAKRVVHAVEQMVHLTRGSVFVGASVGIALSTAGDATADDLVRHADLAVYRAKELGRGRVEMYDTRLHAESQARLTTEVQLRAALANGEIVCHYQPIVALQTGQIIGFEALARWQHPGRGLIGPGEFVPVAEDTGLVVPLGRQMLEGSCRDLARWREQGLAADDTFVSVNLAARQLAEPDLPGVVQRALARHGLDPASLCLEITETAVMADVDTGIEVLDALHELGVRLAVDDFGTGQSSLTYLRRLPVDSVKVDQSFVLELGSHASGATIVAAVVDLAHALGLAVVAEGVERREHLDALVALGCDAAQGYLFAAAMPTERVVEYLAERGSGAATAPAG